MWFDPPVAPTKKTDWASALKRVVDFEFVEDFWGMFNNVVQPTKLAPGSNYHMFKFGIEPKWEDVQNMRGGKWVLSLAKTSPVGFDNLWLNALLACIGEQFGDQSAQICGLVASPRPKFDRLSLWTSQSSDTAGVREIGLALRRELELPETLKINYQYHQDSLEKGTGQTATHMEL
jgi:translation initiation factor 4E